MSPPTVGRIVHISDPRWINIPAIVTAVLGDDETIAATVFYPDGDTIPIRAPHYEPGPGDDIRYGTWHWPKAVQP